MSIPAHATVPEELEDTIERYVIVPDGSRQENPYPAYAELRSIAPVHLTRSGVWLVTGYDAYVKLARDKRISRAEAAKNELGEVSSLPANLQPAMTAAANMIINLDDPAHMRIRKLVRHAFLPAYAREWTPRVEKIAREVVDAVLDKPEFDFIEEVGFPLPEIVMTDLIGVPHEERKIWAGWSREIVGFSRTTGQKAPDVDAARQAIKKFYDYMADHVDKRRASGDFSGTDMLAVLLRAEDGGEQLSRDELVGSMIVLTQASHETTANLLGNAMFHLLHNPARMQELHDDKSLVPAAVEEFLRYESSSHLLLPRVAVEDIEIEGVTIPAGSRVSLLTAAANRDPAVFSNPEELDFHRPPTERHIAFGGGPHSCLGQNLARIEAIAMLEEITQRLNHLELKKPARFAAGRARGLEELIVGPAKS